jgi:hypothetical protein
MRGLFGTASAERRCVPAALMGPGRTALSLTVGPQL